MDGWFKDLSEQIRLVGQEKYVSESKRFFNLNEFPEEIFQKGEEGFREFELNFKNPISISTKISKLAAETIFLNGEISLIQKMRLRLFTPSKTRVYLNGKKIKCFGLF